MTPAVCYECGGASSLTNYRATVIGVGRGGRDRRRVLALCGECMRDRSAEWRWRFRIRGRAPLTSTRVTG